MTKTEGQYRIESARHQVKVMQAIALRSKNALDMDRYYDACDRLESAIKDEQWKNVMRQAIAEGNDPILALLQC
jgi:23S rRNA maturation-related 3'-5' exoribonuclease YhaM